MNSLIPNICALIVLTLGCISCIQELHAQNSEDNRERFSDEQLEYFEAKVRPLLVKHCYQCHGPDVEKVKGGLSLASRSTTLTGGDSGPAIVPGDAEDSLLADSIRYGDLYQMPPNKKLTKNEVAVFEKWITDGAAWSDDTKTTKTIVKDKFDLEKRKAAHWCWQPILNHSIPEVKDTNWPRNSIDRFILNQLELKGIAPAPQADRYTLIRRLYFDIIGLPPTSQQVHAFVNDDSPGAFEKVVDDLLASPHFGERWARHWLDLVRYAESYGHQYDYDMPHAYRYRDYLIRAFNNDISYKQLIHEHIAGDLLINPRRNLDEDYNESILGTAFWYLGQAKPGAVDSRANEAELIDDRIDTMSKTFLGLTVSCARCHDHKFDAISTEDYYSLYGFFRSSTRQLAMLDPGRTIEQSFARTLELTAKGDQLVAQLANRLTKLDAAKFATHLDAAVTMLRNSNNASAKDHKNTKFNDTGLEKKFVNQLSKLIASDDAAQQDHPLHLLRLAVDLPGSVDEQFAKNVSIKAKQAIESEKAWNNNSTQFEDFSNGIPEGWSHTGFAFADNHEAGKLVQFSANGSPINPASSIDSGRNGREYYGVMRSPTFVLDHPKVHYRVRGKGITIRLIIDGFFMDEYRDLLFRKALFKIEPGNRFGWQTQAGDLKLRLGSKAHLEIIDHGDGFACIDEIRFSNSSTPPAPSVFANKDLLDSKQYANQSSLCYFVANSITQSLNDPGTADGSDISNWILKNNLLPAFESLADTNANSADTNTQLKSFEELRLEINDLVKNVQSASSNAPAPRFSIGITDVTGEDEHVFVRGHYKTTGKLARRKLLSAFSEKPFEIEGGSGRLLLAKKITANDNPLTTRVAANRVWHHLIGRGIVPTVDNFGVLGQRPTHPKLLDHLALEFAKNNWSIKRLIRSIVLSRTYQMSSVASESNELLDPENKLMHCARVRRLQSEAIRDSILSVSGRLNRELHGKPVPVHLTSFMTGRGRPKKSGPIDGDGRRTIYIAVRRNFMSPMMLAFDSPIPINATGRRNLSNVPAQALIMMNSQFVNQQATVWANRLVIKGQTVDQRIDDIYMNALSRPPTQFELQAGKTFIETLAGELAVPENEILENENIWQEYCHVIFNLKEFIFLN